MIYSARLSKFIDFELQANMDLARLETSNPRSPKWPSLVKKIIKKSPYCAFCGETSKTTELVGHHILPYHKFPELELEESNVLVVGETCNTGNHHLLLCHFGDFRKWNPDARELARIFLLNKQAGLECYSPILIPLVRQ